MRLSEEKKIFVLHNLQVGISLNKLSRETGIAKSTLYYYYKKLRGKRFTPPYVTPGNSETEGEIVGIFAGDGSQYYDKKDGKYEVNVHFGMHNETYALYVQQLLLSFFKKKFNLKNEQKTYRLRTQSKDIYNYFKNYLAYDPHIKHVTVHLHSLDFPLEFKRGFLRGLFDTDGSIRYNTHDKVVRATFHTTSWELAEQVRMLLAEFDIKHTHYEQRRHGYKPAYIVRIRTSAVRKFLNTVRPFKEKLLQGA
jgi:intein/homing endonuclease